MIISPIQKQKSADVHLEMPYIIKINSSKAIKKRSLKKNHGWYNTFKDKKQQRWC